MDISSLGNYIAASRFATDSADETLRKEIPKRRFLASKNLIVPEIERNFLLQPSQADDIDQVGNPTQKFEQKIGYKVNLRV